MDILSFLYPLCNLTFSLDLIVSGEGHDLTVSLCAHKEKLMKEELTICDSKDNSKSIKLILHARVLGELFFLSTCVEYLCTLVLGWSSFPDFLDNSLRLPK